MEGVVQKKNRGIKKEKWKRLSIAVKCTIKFGKKYMGQVCVGLTERLQRKHETFICSNKE
jgi:hypothetical protein